MFNTKLKQKIRDLETQIASQSQKIQKQQIDNQFLQWQLNNPAKFAIGERIGEYVVISRSCDQGKFNNIIFNVLLKTIMLLHICRIRIKNQTSKEFNDFVSKSYQSLWQYELKNTTTGATENKLEIELLVIKQDLSEKNMMDAEVKQDEQTNIFTEPEAKLCQLVCWKKQCEFNVDKHCTHSAPNIHINKNSRAICFSSKF